MVILGLSAMGGYTPAPGFLEAAGQQFEALLPEFGVQVPLCRADCLQLSWNKGWVQGTEPKKV